MAEENNMHVKVAMAEVFGLFLIGFIATLVGMFGLEQYDNLSVIIGVAPTVGLLLLVATIVAFLNENLLLTAIFGVLALFLMAFSGIISGNPGDEAGSTAVAFVGIALLVLALVSFMQPVKMLPILLIVAGVAFIMLALWWAEPNPMDNDYRMLVGVFWTLTAVISTYMGAAITVLVMKGKPLLPLLIKA